MIAASSVSFSSKNIQFAQFIILITLGCCHETRLGSRWRSADLPTSLSRILDNIEIHMTIYVDHTHVGRHVTGLERITLELFSA